MSIRILLVGMSHSNAIYNGFSPAARESVEFRNFQITPELVCAETRRLNADMFPSTTPDVVILSMGGSVHIVLGLLNHPQPFAIGDPLVGRIPSDPARSFIPLDAMREVFASALSVVFAQADQIHAMYPGVPSIYVQAPPPISDEAHIRTYAKSFEEKLHLGVSPPDLRMALYALQCRAYAQQAAKHMAGILQAPIAALTPEGFLDPDFAAKDPVHGNAAYGRLVVDQISALMENT